MGDDILTTHYKNNSSNLDYHDELRHLWHTNDIRKTATIFEDSANSTINKNAIIDPTLDPNNYRIYKWKKIKKPKSLGQTSPKTIQSRQPQDPQEPPKRSMIVN
jgi:hypothetical protein